MFTRDGVLYRQINQVYAESFEQLARCGLYDRLVRDGLLIPHEPADVPAADPGPAYRVIRPERLDFISQPFEWPFSALKQAALTTLRIQETAMSHGMSLKDASAYNIQFRHARPVFIDTLSFEPYRAGQPWVAYQQFCKHFLAPLSVMAKRDVRFGRLLELHVDGIPLDLASQLLPRRSLLNAGLFLHLHLHARSQKKFAGAAGNDASAAKPTRAVSERAALGILDSLRSTIEGLDWAPIDTEWGAYYESTNYSDAAMEEKLALVSSFLDRVQPRSVWDLGANTGRFSRIASRRGIATVAFDIDPVAVESNFRACVESNEQHLLPLLLDLTNPSAAIGWQNSERESFMDRAPVDTVFALALLHHLCISNNVPLAMVAEFFARICRSLIIEFVPKQDSQVRRLLATRQDVFPDYHEDGFRASFAKYFEVQEARKIRESERTLFLMTKRG